MSFLRACGLAMLVASGFPAAIAAGAAPRGAEDGFVLVDSIDALRRHAAVPRAKVRLQPGTYVLDRATSREFIAITGAGSQWDLTGVTLRVDTRLFRQFGGGNEYCVFALAGDGIELRGVKTENFGDQPGLQSKNKIFNITGSNVVLRDVDVTTSGSSPWGYGSLFGISGGDVRKMNGIRVGWPARNVKLIGCRVHMRAMGHAIFVQGAEGTLIQDCHVDGLLRPTNEILAETSGYAFARAFTTASPRYNEGVRTGTDGRILRDEMIALSEDGIRLYGEFGPGRRTGRTTIIDCTVTRMRRGICTGLGPAADTIENCQVTDCVAAGFNIGNGDVVRGCRADAKYAEALSLPYVTSREASVELEILDSRDGVANDLLAVINGERHRVTLRTSDPALVPTSFTIELATRRGYAHYQSAEPRAKDLVLVNATPAAVKAIGAASNNRILPAPAP